MRVTYRPIENYPGERSRNVKPSPFGAKWESTLVLLDAELRALGASEVVFQLDVSEAEIRLDGLPRADARAKSPAVVISFESKHGPLQFATDVFPSWKDNVRAIALGLESLRRVDRYGITRHAEQYTGWRQLGAGIPMPASSGAMTVEDALRFLIEYGEWGGEPATLDQMTTAWEANDPVIRSYYREATKRLHPDAGGDPELFKRLGEAMAVLGE